MSEGFSNPIIGGGGGLAYPSIHSPNFVAGSAGWTINKDGSAEFNNLTIRNGQIISGVFLLYSSGTPAKGNLVVAFAPVAGGTDHVGNVYPQGFNFGTWDATGALKQHFGIDTSGNLYLAGNDGVVRIVMDNNPPRIYFKNDFAATLAELVTAATNGPGFFFYEDLGSASQGALIAAILSAASTVTDPQNGTLVQPGLSAMDSAGNPTVLAGSGISTQFNGHNVGALGYVNHGTPAWYLQAFSGFSQVMSDPIAAVDPATPPSPKPETWHTLSPTPAGWTGSINFRQLNEAGSLVMLNVEISIANGTVVANPTQLCTLPAGYFFPTDNKVLIFSVNGVPCELFLNTAGHLSYVSAGFTASPSFLYGQAIYTTAI